MNNNIFYRKKIRFQKMLHTGIFYTIELLFMRFMEQGIKMKANYFKEILKI